MRFGDPECQGLMARCDSDLLEAMLAAAAGEMEDPLVIPSWALVPWAPELTDPF